ncbi:MAG: T9SS type A sorting domain-containing protein [Bacteroidetes bacterium]|nr:T9SS type A sorting domain-containing protein [Bacteroidota bacterium]
MKTSITFLLFLLLAFFAAQSQTQTWQWAKRVGTVNDNNGNPFNPTYNEAISDVKADKYGNSYAVGYFYSDPTFVNVTNGLPATGGYGGLDGYLIKYNSCGSTVWWRRVGSVGDDGLSSLVFDNNGNIQVLSGAASTATIDGNNGIDTIISGGGTFIAKFDTAGNFINKLDVPNVGKLFITSQGDYFLTNGITGARVNTLGVTTATYAYATATAAPGIYGIALDKNDNVYLSGNFNKLINIAQGTTLVPVGTTVSPNTYYPNSLVMKFSSTGTLLWYNTSNNTNIGGDVLDGGAILDTSQNVLYCGGKTGFGTNVVFGYTVNVVSVAGMIFRFDCNTGNLLSGTTGTFSLNGKIKVDCSDIDNYVHCDGLIFGNNNTLTFNTITVSANGLRQSYIGKFDASGNVINITMLPQSGSLHEAINGLDVNEQGNVYIGGMFGGTLDSAGTAVNIIGGTVDGFVAKYGFACNSSGTSLSPLPPTSLAAQYQATLTNYVTWIDNAQYENNYELWYNTNSNPTFSLLATLPANTTSYTHTSLAYNTTYCYKARAVNNIGASFFTNVGCAATPTTGGGTGTAPNAPLNLTAVNNGSLTNNVAWNDNSNNEDNFELHYTTGSAANYSLLATLPANTTSYTHTGLSYTTTYCYKVAATNSAGSSAFSNTACATTPAAPDSTIGIVKLKDESLTLRVYPNPANTEIYFDVPGNEKQIHIELYNMLGSLVISKKNYTNRSAISISTLSKGVYYYKVILPKGEFAGKVVKEE